MTAHSIFTECDVLIKAGVCACKCLCTCAQGINDSKQFCRWTDLHFKHLNIHRCIHTHTHTRTNTHKHRRSPICSVLGVDFVTVVQNGMIEITVIGGHVTAPSGRCVCVCACSPPVCVTISLCFCLCEDQIKTLIVRTLFGKFRLSPLSGCRLKT